MTPTTPKTVIIMVVAFLGLYALAALGGTIWLGSLKSTSSEIGLVSASGGMALGGLTALLAHTSTIENPPPATPVAGSTMAPLGDGSVPPSQP